MIMNLKNIYLRNLIQFIIKSFIKNDEGNKEIEFSNSLFSNFLDEYISFYKKETEKIIDSIKEKKAIEYLNAQVIIEKTKNTNIEINNKFNKNEFISLIKIILEKVFYYVAQKFFIYQLIIEFCDYFSESINNKMNSTLKDVLNNSENNYYFEEVYQQKIEDLEKKVKIFYSNKEYEKFEDNPARSNCCLVV